MIRLTIPGRLDGYNDTIDANRKSGVVGDRHKKKNQKIVEDAIEASRLRPIPDGTAVNVHFMWHEPNNRRDHDNITAAKKFILDALVKKGILKNDSPRYVHDFTDTFYIDRKNPRIEVDLEVIWTE